MERRALMGYVCISANMVKSAPKCCCDIAHQWRELSSVVSIEFIFVDVVSRKDVKRIIKHYKRMQGRQSSVSETQKNRPGEACT